MTIAARFKESDITRAVKGARKAGLVVGRIEIDPNGTIVVYAAEHGTLTGRASSLDRLLLGRG